MRKNVVIIVDGTGCSAVNGRDRELSNAFRLASAIETDLKPSDNSVQIVHYFSGPASRNLPTKLVGAITGQETQEIVSEAYLTLVNTFDRKENCDIYLFGFSRGAIAVKVLAEIICRVGVLQKDGCSLLRYVWKKYHQEDHPDKLFLVDQLRTSAVRFLGVFDPVHGPVTPILDVVPNPVIPDDVDYAVEICALDETRLAFNPTFWSDRNEESAITSIAPEFATKRSSRLQHIWLPGGHSDVGSAITQSVLADLAFLAMVERITNCTPLPLRKEIVEQVFSRIIARSDTFRINPHHFPFFGSNRILGRALNSEMHPIFDLMLNKKILQPKRASLYRTRARFETNHRDIPRYDTNFSSISGSLLDIDAQINRALTRILGEI